jgi:hypothetical protein
MKPGIMTITDVEGGGLLGPIRCFNQYVFREEQDVHGLTVHVLGEMLDKPAVEIIGRTAGGVRVRAELSVEGHDTNPIDRATWLKSEVQKVLGACRQLPILGRMVRRIESVRVIIKITPISQEVRSSVAAVVTIAANCSAEKIRF